NDVVALDATTGRAFWTYRYTPVAERLVCRGGNKRGLPALGSSLFLGTAGERLVCCGANNPGLAILGNTLFMGRLDAQLIAIDATSGHPIWKTEVGSAKSAYSISLAPLVVKDKVIVGVGGGEYGIRGFIAAYDAATGRELWRFY